MLSVEHCKEEGSILLLALCCDVGKITLKIEISRVVVEDGCHIDLMEVGHIDRLDLRQLECPFLFTEEVSQVVLVD